MSSQPGGGPAIPAAAAVSGLASDKDQDDATRSGDDDDDSFITAGMQEPETDEDGTPIGMADAEQDRLRAKDQSDS
jgi:hypothetical protein